jgi:hypothetical protein
LSTQGFDNQSYSLLLLPDKLFHTGYLILYFHSIQREYMRVFTKNKNLGALLAENIFSKKG